MMARNSFMRLEGARELEAALMELPKATGKNTLRRAIKNALAPITAEAQLLAPFRTGLLRRSITETRVTFSSGSAGKRAFAEALKKGATRAEAGAAAREANTGGSDVTSALAMTGSGLAPHAHLQEFGTVNHPPKPFMRPAWDGRKRGAAEAIRDELKSEIEKAAKRIARKAAREAAKGLV
jgi:HK97 gp10 family phage protein